MTLTQGFDFMTLSLFAFLYKERRSKRSEFNEALAIKGTLPQNIFNFINGQIGFIYFKDIGCLTK